MKTEERAITGKAFDGLLAALDPDRDQAGERYEMLRRKLAAFFRWRGMELAEDLADQALDVTARRLLEGEPIQNVSGYCLGVARMILRKSRGQQNRDMAAIDELEAPPISEPALEVDVRVQCFDACLQKLGAEDRNLILSYYQGEQHVKIAARKELAKLLGIPLNALRIRAFRIRARLEEAIRECMKRLAVQRK